MKFDCSTPNALNFYFVSVQWFIPPIFNVNPRQVPAIFVWLFVDFPSAVGRIGCSFVAPILPCPVESYQARNWKQHRKCNFNINQNAGRNFGKRYKLFWHFDSHVYLNRAELSILNRASQDGTGGDA